MVTPREVITEGTMKKIVKNKKRENSVEPKTLSKKISEKLIRKIIDGEYPAGSKLPTEREMAESLGVARHVLREALKRVETMRLISIRQGSGAVIQDYKATGGIELVDTLLLKKDGSIDKDFLQNIMEFHHFASVFTVKLTAQRITDEEIYQLRRLLQERSKHSEDLEERSALSMQISELFVKASRNMYIQLIFNSLIRANVSFEQIFGMPLSDSDNVQIYMERILDAVERRDHELASLIADRAFKDNHDYMMNTMEKFLLKGIDRPNC